MVISNDSAIISLKERDRLVQLEKDFKGWKIKIKEGKKYTICNPPQSFYSYTGDRKTYDAYIEFYTESELFEQYKEKLSKEYHELRASLQRDNERLLNSKSLSTIAEINHLEETIRGLGIKNELLQNEIKRLKLPWYKKLFK